MLSLRDFSLEYESENPVLRGLSLSLEAGSVLCLVGESGAGKSSLARALLGLRDGAKRSGV
ncbi:MAG: ATP-binding cassette domain-containing protein, partial [Burkholderiaceae bacterium]